MRGAHALSIHISFAGGEVAPHLANRPLPPALPLWKTRLANTGLPIASPRGLFPLKRAWSVDSVAWEKQANSNTASDMDKDFFRIIVGFLS